MTTCNLEKIKKLDTKLDQSEHTIKQLKEDIKTKIDDNKNVM